MHDREGIERTLSRNGNRLAVLPRRAAGRAAERACRKGQVLTLAAPGGQRLRGQAARRNGVEAGMAGSGFAHDDRRWNYGEADWQDLTVARPALPMPIVSLRERWRVQASPRTRPGAQAAQAALPNRSAAQFSRRAAPTASRCSASVPSTRQARLLRPRAPASPKPAHRSLARPPSIVVKPAHDDDAIDRLRTTFPPI